MLNKRDILKILTKHMDYTFLDEDKTENINAIEFAIKVYQKDEYYIKNNYMNIPNDDAMKNEIILIAILYTESFFVKLLVVLFKIKINTYLLLHACEYNFDLSMIKYLINDLNMDYLKVFEPYSIDNCLMKACRKNKNLDIIKYLINECHMDVNFLNNKGENCLHAACENPNPLVIKYLIEECRMNVKSKDKKNLNLLNKAKLSNNIDIIKYFTKLEKI